LTTTQKSNTTSDDSNDFQPITDEELGLEPDENEVSVQGKSFDEGEASGSPTLSTDECDFICAHLKAGAPPRA
jgi:hypothetical protein